MKLLIAIFLVSFSATAQDIELNNELQITPIVIENNTIELIEDANLNLFNKDSKSLLVRKKSYKNIIEKTLSGEKFLIFKAKRDIKIC
ncbi:hypothetical protein ACFS5M_07460 [Lacinutrix iliipiscaria]|uniref:Uncharacterized protein n=1 Tax=Lacinutrix iliipiscaria TaxID=1230532 RepID=A0ABW5WMR5_9FLAO